MVYNWDYEFVFSFNIYQLTSKQQLVLYFRLVGMNYQPKLEHNVCSNSFYYLFLVYLLNGPVYSELVIVDT
jgi:hypothetical protein